MAFLEDSQGIGAPSGQVGEISPHVRRTRTLLAAAREGDDWALEELLRLHGTAAYRIALGMLGDPDQAADVCRQVFLHFFRVMRRLRAERDVPAWLRRVTIHRCYDVLRTRRRRDKPDTALMPACMLGAAGIDPEELSRMLEIGLDHLNPRERAALILTCHKGYSVEDAAEAMGVQPNTVLMLVEKGRWKLKILLTGHTEEKIPADEEKHKNMVDYINGHLSEGDKRRLEEQFESDPALKSEAEACRREIGILRGAAGDLFEESRLRSIYSDIMLQFRQKSSTSFRGLPLPMRSYLRASAAVALVLIGFVIFFLLHQSPEANSDGGEQSNALSKVKSRQQNSNIPQQSGTEIQKSRAAPADSEEPGGDRIHMIMFPEKKVKIHWFMIKDFKL